MVTRLSVGHICRLGESFRTFRPLLMLYYHLARLGKGERLEGEVLCSSHKLNSLHGQGPPHTTSVLRLLLFSVSPSPCFCVSPFPSPRFLFLSYFYFFFLFYSLRHELLRVSRLQTPLGWRVEPRDGSIFTQKVLVHATKQSFMPLRQLQRWIKLYERACRWGQSAN